jgi:hypothetical protein
MMVTGEPCGVATGGTVCTRRELTPPLHHTHRQKKQAWRELAT